MGGETDSTNVIPHVIATGVAGLGYDYQNKLGDTIESIAWHKAGIFKPRVPAFSVSQNQAAKEVLRARALEKHTEVCIVNGHMFQANGITVTPPMPFQLANAALAVALASTVVLAINPKESLTLRDIKSLEQTVLPTKFETLTRGQVTRVLSSVHNLMSVRSVSQAFKIMFER